MSAISPSAESIPSSATDAVAPIDPAIPAAEHQLSEIRDLLFGEQMRGIHNNVKLLQRDMQDRMEALASRMTQNLEQARKDFTARLDELGQHVEQLNRQQDSRLAAAHDELDSAIASLRQDAERSDQTLEQQLVDMSATLHELISTRVQELSQQLTQTQLELRYSKADRKILASLLDRMATELNQDN